MNKTNCDLEKKMPTMRLLHIFVLCSMQESDVAGTYYTSAETTSGEVRCRIPVFALDDNSTLQLYNWTISVSSDNSTWSNSSQLLVYDPMYVTCNDEGNQTTFLPAQVHQSVDFCANYCSSSSSSSSSRTKSQKHHASAK